MSFISDLEWFHYAGAGLFLVIMIGIIAGLVLRKRGKNELVSWDDIAALENGSYKVDEHQSTVGAVGSVPMQQQAPPPLPIVENAI